MGTLVSPLAVTVAARHWLASPICVNMIKIYERLYPVSFSRTSCFCNARPQLRIVLGSKIDRGTVAMRGVRIATDRDDLLARISITARDFHFAPDGLGYCV